MVTVAIHVETMSFNERAATNHSSPNANQSERRQIYIKTREAAKATCLTETDRQTDRPTDTNCTV
jgi:hypothetical protein